MEGEKRVFNKFFFNYYYFALFLFLFYFCFFSSVLSFIFSFKFRVKVWSCREIFEHNFLGSLDLVFTASKQSSIVGILRDLLNQTFCIN